MRRCAILCLGLLGAAGASPAQDATVAALLRDPSLSRTEVVFSSRGRIWIAPRAGGPAHRLTAGDFAEDSPVFSPDGTRVAFSRADDVCVVPAGGGEPRRLTWHPRGESPVGWSPDGHYILFLSDRLRPLPSTPRLFRVPASGGMEEALPMPVAGFASYSPDGARIAYSPVPEMTVYMGRKRYRGGATAFLGIYEPATNRYQELLRTGANDMYPMWRGESIYFASDRSGTVNVYSYDLRSRATTQLTSFTDFDVLEPKLGPDAIVYHRGGRLYTCDLETGAVRDLAVTLPPAGVSPEQRALWASVFDGVWKTYRDRAAAPVPGWDAARVKYEPLLAGVGDRSDLQFVLSQMLSETGQSHIMLMAPPPATPRPEVATAGLLGADYAVDHGLYRFTRIYQGPGAPLAGVAEGEYLLAVNGRPLRPPANLFAAFEGTDGNPVRLTVNHEPAEAGAREVTVTPIRNEQGLRYAAWVEERRRRVREATAGRVAYIHVPEIEPPGAEAARKQFDEQPGAQALILDVRNNNGGVMVDFFLDLLMRKPERALTGRGGKTVTFPEFAVPGPKVILANEQSVSGAEELAYLAQRRKLAAFVGSRTSGSLIGTGTDYHLADGTVMLIPEWAFFTIEDGRWYPEGRGVVPDYPVDQRPDLVAAGQDPQLEKAIELALDGLQRLSQPPPPARTSAGLPRFE